MRDNKNKIRQKAYKDPTAIEALGNMSDKISFIKLSIPGEPVGKGRPRFGNGRIYTPELTVDYENKIKQEYLLLYRSFSFGEKIPLSVKIKAFYGIPQKASEKVRELMLQGVMKPTKKPDGDNIIKVILDGLNGLAYADDSQVVNIEFFKNYSNNPRVEVKVNKFN